MLMAMTFMTKVCGMDERAVGRGSWQRHNGVPIATPVFDGAKEADVNDALKRAGFRHIWSVHLV